MYTEPLQKYVVLPLEKAANALFSQRYNPFYYHGALPNFFIWVLFLSGLLLFAYYSPTLARAYETVRYITYEVPYGNAIRSIHRYASDGMMIFVMLHLFRVWFTDRYREYRILPWVTGVILLIITFLVGLTGYLMIWDQDAVALTNITTNLLNNFPLGGEAMATFLLGGRIITDYTLTRFLFLHLAIPVLLMFFLWMHYMRITRPVTTPPFALNMLMLGALLAICGFFPVELGAAPPKDFNTAGIGGIEFSMLYSWPQWLAAQGLPLAIVWLAVLAVPVGLLVLPYLQKKQWREQFAKVIVDNCTGCSLCYHDCPYEAITMIERASRDDLPESRFKKLAIVDPGRCANCGLCVGACAFKAIEIPRRQSGDVLTEIQQALAATSPA